MTLLALATGGTIASRFDASGAVVPAVAPGELLKAVPGLDELGPIEVEEIDRGQRLGRHAVDDGAGCRAGGGGVARRFGCRGGGHPCTDTVEETLYLTDLLAGAVTRVGGIVVACAMRAVFDLGADGPRNFRNAGVTALDPAARGRGALLASTTSCTRLGGRPRPTPPTSAPSAHPVPAASSRACRASGPRRPPGRRAARRSTPRSRCSPRLRAWTPRRSGGLLQDGIHGIVVVGTEAGNVPGTLVPGLAEAVDAGVPVVVAPRCWAGHTVSIYGGAGSGVTLRDLGVIGAVGSARAQGPAGAHGRPGRHAGGPVRHSCLVRRCDGSRP